MRFGILGEAAAWHADGSVVPLQRPKVRALLTLLALDAGRVVSTERLIDGVYADDPPEGASNALQAQVSRLRRQLGVGTDLIERHGSGYRLAVDPALVDAHDFERRVTDAKSALDAGDPEHAAEVLGEALDLWRGPALSDAADSTCRTRWPRPAGGASARGARDARRGRHRARCDRGGHSSATRPRGRPPDPRKPVAAADPRVVEIRTSGRGTRCLRGSPRGARR